MKKLLIVVDKIGKKKELFAELIAKGLPPGMGVSIARFSDLTYHVDGKTVEIKIDGINANIRDFNLVYIRRAGTKYFSMAGTLAICLKNMGIGYFDTAFENIGPAGDKFTSYVRLSLAGLPTMPSYYCSYQNLDMHIDEIAAKFGLPLIAKQLSSQRGKGVIMIRERSDFARLPKEFPEGDFMFQGFYKSNEEYRILVLGGTIGAYEKKVRTDENEFRSNVSLGAREEFIDVSKIPAGHKDIAIRAAKALNIEIAGVDLLIDDAGTSWLLEVNRGPGLTYDTDISPELPNMAKFFEAEMKKND